MAFLPLRPHHPNPMELGMNEDELKGQWQQLKVSAKEK
jgi:hypothetical protein